MNSEDSVDITMDVCLTTVEPSLWPLNKFLDSKFDSFPENFNVVHINAQSIPCHYIDFVASFDVKNLHAILVSETWLKPECPEYEYALPGFHLIRNDRNGKRGGGVGIYLRNGIQFNKVSESTATSLDEYSQSPEYLFGTVECDDNRKVLLGVYYAPSKKVNYFQNLENLLEQFVATVDHVIIKGDFNTCLIKNDARTKRFKNIMSRFNLSILHTDATHHFPGKTPSLLDIMLVSSATHVSNHGQAPARAFSYHDLVYLSYSLTFKTKIFYNHSLPDEIKILISKSTATKAKYRRNKTKDIENKYKRLQKVCKKALKMHNTRLSIVNVNGSKG